MEKNVRELKIHDFLNGGFREFSTYDCKINIPSMIDGFKVSQRKVMHTMLTRNKNMKVEQFANDAAGFTHYHHGALNLEGVIVGLAQQFSGTNNVNFLTPDGQFGNILDHSAAAGRYICVEPNANFRKWFAKADDCILEYEYEDGEQIEPKYFIPIVPALLFNGSAGIGTGYATRIFNYNPSDVLSNVKLAIAGKKLKPMTPCFVDYAGKVEKIANQVVYTGTFERTNSTTIRITSLPIGYDLNAYKAELIKLIEKEVIRDFDDNSSPDAWNILIYATRQFVGLPDTTLIEKLKLVSRDSENITVWDENGKIKRFESPEELIIYFVEWRKTAYQRRKNKRVSILTHELDLLNEKIRFIRYYVKNAKWFSESSKNDIISTLSDQKFKNIDDLLSIRVYNLTREQICKFEEDIKELELTLTTLTNTTAVDLYLYDISSLKLTK